MDGKLVAIKEIEEERYGNPDRKWFAVRQFLHEVKYSSLVSHKNFGKLHGICLERRLSIISEFIKGSPLDEILCKRIIKVPEAMNYIEQINEGMIYLHSNLPEKPPIIHRDLKPANIIISRKGIVKIIDLGISTLTKLEDKIWRM